MYIYADSTQNTKIPKYIADSSYSTITNTYEKTAVTPSLNIQNMTYNNCQPALFKLSWAVNLKQVDQ